MPNLLKAVRDVLMSRGYELSGRTMVSSAALERLIEAYEAATRP